jgi:hypothetical protein
MLRGGVRVGVRPSLEAQRERARSQIAALPERLRALTPAPPYRVEIADSLRALADAVDARSAARP